MKNNKERKEYFKLYYIKNKEKIRLTVLKYRKENKEKLRLYIKNYREENKEKLRLYIKNYKIKNPQVQKYRKQQNIYQQKRIEKDINFKLKTRLRSRMCMAIKRNNKKGSVIKDLGCTIPELKIYLEKQFKNGMNWSNWSKKGWNIDHKIPLAFFDLSKREHFLQACHYTNLQPLWAIENIKKRDKLLLA